VKLSISSFYERFTPKIVGLISFRGACSIRLSFKHSNPVVFWAIAINTSVGPWLKGCILLIDLGYFKYLFFDRIARYGGYLISRLKGNVNRYTHLRWAKVFTEQADRLLTEVLECVRLKLEPIYSLYTTFTSAKDAIQKSNERG